MTTEPRTLAPSTSTDSLHSRNRNADARTLTPTQSVDSLHKSPSGRLMPAPQLLEWVGERAHECRDDLQQLEEAANEKLRESASQHQARLDALPEENWKIPEENGTSLGQSRSSASLLSVDSDGPTRGPIPPKRSAALDTRGVFRSSMPTHASYSGLRAALLQGGRAGMAAKGDARSSVDSAAVTIRGSQSGGLPKAAVDHSVAKVEDRSSRQPLSQPRSMVQSRSEPESPQKPRNTQEALTTQSLTTNTQGKLTTLIDHGNSQIVDIESAHEDSNAVAPPVPVESKPPVSNSGGQPTWIIEEVIDFGLPYEDQTGRDCDDNFACKNLETTRGPMFERCGAGSICYDEDPFFVPSRINKENRNRCWDRL